MVHRIGGPVLNAAIPVRPTARTGGTRPRRTGPTRRRGFLSGDAGLPSRRTTEIDPRSTDEPLADPVEAAPPAALLVAVASRLPAAVLPFGYAVRAVRHELAGEATLPWFGVLVAAAAGDAPSSGPAGAPGASTVSEGTATGSNTPA
jgi:hypothetical protein